MLELYLRNRLFWKLVHDPKFQPERRRTKAGLERLLANTTLPGRSAERTGCATSAGYDDNEAVCTPHEGTWLELVDAAGRHHQIRLLIEDGWAKLTGTAEREKCRSQRT